MASISTKLPRPGLAFGRYPERRHTPPGRLDDRVGKALSRLEVRWEYRKSRLADVAENIDRIGQSLSGLSDEGLQAFINELRPSLVYAGWKQDNIEKGFAAVREMSDRQLGLRHHASQLQAGWVMYHGILAEMQTGEGKTLAATLPAATAAMCGVPVHVITANDYLASRDATAMRPLYEALGLRLGIVTESMNEAQRREAYACDITYCSNKQLAFDYLRDRVARGATLGKLSLDIEHIRDDRPVSGGLMLRGLCFAIVDEADSVLIDEARTPLVLSRSVVGDNPNYGMCEEALDLARGLTESDDFTINVVERQVVLSSLGCERLAERAEGMSPVWRASRQREALVRQALSALELHERDRDYLVVDGKVQIVDSHTGRVMADSSWERGLQQMIECKERCELSRGRETLARISYQRFFRRYHRLSGMTGTAREVEHELGEVYGLNVVCISPHRKNIRVAYPEQVFLHRDDTISAVINSAREQTKLGRAVLIGTRSVSGSEELSQRMSEAGLSVQVLNARQDANEASIISQAGNDSQITVATNMAGRGTDILLGQGVRDCGGLHVIVTERNDSSRIDRQLIGRCARQGDPGSFQCFSSLEDDILKAHFHVSLLRWLAYLESVGLIRLSSAPARRVLDLAQRHRERLHQGQRRRVEQEDDRLNTVLSFSGPSE